ncbi:UNVERIFIED_CONTAM: hypothetical protein PYX00_007562 [Menopon gallinae]
MAGSGEEHVDDGFWVFYRDRSEWKDVQPIPQDDGPFPVVSISYSEKFRDVYDYFRAILKSQEKSERALVLTEDALELNPANYTVWQYRREILKHLNKDLKEELKYIRGMIETNEKNYQVWHHRRMIVEWMQDPSQELRLTEIILSSDAKNYHAWQYRQWVIRTFNLYEKELDFVELLLEDDVRNNSAWNQRYFVINNTTNFTPAVIDREIDFTIGKIKLVTCNESAWNYLRGIMLHAEQDIEAQKKVRTFCEQLYMEGNRSPHLLSYLVDLCVEVDSQDAGDQFLNKAKALELCSELANEHDKIRCMYWNYIARTIAQ